MGKKGKNGQNKKLHSKLIQQKKDKVLSAKEKRKALMREMNKKAASINKTESE